MTDFNQNLTVVIPTRNRVRFLKRLLNYYRSQGCRYPILIADSSELVNQLDLKKYIETLCGAISVEIVEFDPFVTFNQKLVTVMADINTPYTVIGADDDFHIPSSLELAIEFLDDNPMYSLVHGEAILFQLKDGIEHGKVMETVRYEQRSVLHSTAHARLRSHLERYSTTWYSVQRTKLLRENIRMMAEYSLDSYFAELLPSFLSVIQGKTRKLECLYMVRQAHLGTTSSQQALEIDFFDRLVNPNWSLQYQGLSKCLSGALATYDNMSFDEANDLVKQNLWAYFRDNLNDEWAEKYCHADMNVTRRAKRAFRRSIVIRKIWHTVRLGVRSRIAGNENQSLLPALLRVRSKYHRDFMPVYEAVVESI